MNKRRDEDRELWERVKKTAKPLHANFAQLELESASTEQKVKPSSRQLNANPKVLRPYRQDTGSGIHISLAPKPKPLDQKTAQNISKGRIEIDSKLDLHGMNQAEAYSRLYRFLEIAFATNRRTVLVITGKGVRGEGVLKSMVPRWLSEPKFRNIVIGYHDASIQHGGTGALYVRVRNKVKP